jgi:hypothetical protein
MSLQCRRACAQGKHGGHTIPRVKTLGDLCTATSMRLETMKVRFLILSVPLAITGCMCAGGGGQTVQQHQLQQQQQQQCQLQ